MCVDQREHAASRRFATLNPLKELLLAQGGEL
jgi:hypothetical protein